MVKKMNKDNPKEVTIKLDKKQDFLFIRIIGKTFGTFFRLIAIFISEAWDGFLGQEQKPKKKKRGKKK